MCVHATVHTCILCVFMRCIQCTTSPIPYIVKFFKHAIFKDSTSFHCSLFSFTNILSPSPSLPAFYPPADDSIYECDSNNKGANCLCVSQCNSDHDHCWEVWVLLPHKQRCHLQCAVQSLAKQSTEWGDWLHIIRIRTPVYTCPGIAGLSGPTMTVYMWLSW